MLEISKLDNLTPREDYTRSIKESVINEPGMDTFTLLKKQSPAAKIIEEDYILNGLKGYRKSITYKENGQIAYGSVIIVDGKKWRYRFSQGDIIFESQERFEAIVKTFKVLE